MNKSRILPPLTTRTQTNFSFESSISNITQSTQLDFLKNIEKVQKLEFYPINYSPFIDLSLNPPDKKVDKRSSLMDIIPKKQDFINLYEGIQTTVILEKGKYACYVLRFNERSRKMKFYIENSEKGIYMIYVHSKKLPSKINYEFKYFREEFEIDYKFKDESIKGIFLTVFGLTKLNIIVNFRFVPGLSQRIIYMYRYI